MKIKILGLEVEIKKAQKVEVFEVSKMIDKTQAQKEANEIINSANFQELKEKARLARLARLAN